jgi:hypothetical protein
MVAVGCVEWRDADEHFEDEDAEGVPVHTFIVTCLLDDLIFLSGTR